MPPSNYNTKSSLLAPTPLDTLRQLSRWRISGPKPHVVTSRDEGSKSWCWTQGTASALALITYFANW